MNSRKKTKVVYELILDEKEAEWLRGIMQNPFKLDFYEDPVDEPKEQTTMRALFWEALGGNKNYEE